MAKAGAVIEKMTLPSALSKINALIKGRSYDDLIVIKEAVEEEIAKSLSSVVKMGSKVTIAGRGKSEKEVEVYGITKDYLILQDGDSILKKKYKFSDLIAVEGKHV